MKIDFLRTASLFVLTSWIFVPTSFAAPSATLSKAKKDAEARGFIFETSRDEIIARAKKEGRVRVMTGLQPRAYPTHIKAFKQRYPFIDIYLEERTGTDAAQRLLLELQAGTVRDWDVFSISQDFYDDFAPQAMKIDRPMNV